MTLGQLRKLDLPDDTLVALKILDDQGAQYYTHLRIAQEKFTFWRQSAPHLALIIENCSLDEVTQDEHLRT